MRFSSTFSPIPSISIAVRETKCVSAAKVCAGQDIPAGQHHTTPSSSRTNLVLQTGHRVGNSTAAPRACETTDTILGMTSPARFTKTLLPITNPRRRISSSLCSVAEVTTTPPSLTGASLATGVMAPVRPT